MCREVKSIASESELPGFESHIQVQVYDLGLITYLFLGSGSFVNWDNLIQFIGLRIT